MDVRGEVYKGEERKQKRKQKSFFSFFNLYLTPLRAQQGRGCGCEGEMYKGEEREEKRAETNKNKKKRKKQTNKFLVFF